MKRLMLPLLLAASLACSVPVQAQSGADVINRFGPPDYTGGSVRSPAESFALAYHQVPVEEGIPQAPAPTFLLIGPNPATDEVHILLEAPLLQPAQVSLVSMNGVLMLSKPFEAGSQNLRIEVSAFPAGLYALQVQEQGQAPEVVPFLKTAE
ncbi:MAG: T9SS type A sorting domain-containing protein [Bacteroidetes bacterium]|nr:T9SS type A sorting domain-containing protein [Bacteroidota bacterium]MBS1629579.1 T9SS type A sorting domain-containing protein [Bacteroidota bacterium]